MPANSFKFVSPGIFLNEIDNSQVPQLPGAVGPTVIGRASKGRAMSPINVPSFSDFVDEFGYPNAGGENSEYRASNFAGPTYGAYGAQAYPNANVGPVNFVRLLASHIQMLKRLVTPVGLLWITVLAHQQSVPIAQTLVLWVCS